MKQQHTVLEYIHQIDKVYIRRKRNRKREGGREREREVNSIHAQFAPACFFILSAF